MRQPLLPLLFAASLTAGVIACAATVPGAPATGRSTPGLAPAANRLVDLLAPGDLPAASADESQGLAGDRRAARAGARGAEATPRNFWHAVTELQREQLVSRQTRPTELSLVQQAFAHHLESLRGALRR